MTEKEADSPLARTESVPPRGGVPPLKRKEIERRLTQLEGWRVVKRYHLTKTFEFKDFATALAYVNRVGRMAEEQDHHPDIYLTWGKARIEIWTHQIDGLTESDFVFAAKCDQLR